MSLLLEAIAAKDVTINEDELKAYYDENKDKYKEHEQVKARHILVSGEDDAKDISKQLTKGADFAELAKEKSEDPGSKDKGGDLGYFGKGMMDPEFEKVAFSLKVGETSGPVKSAFGYHIIRVEDRKPERIPAFDEVRDDVLKQVTREKSKPMTSVIMELKDAAQIKINAKDLEDAIFDILY